MLPERDPTFSVHIPRPEGWPTSVCLWGVFVIRARFPHMDLGSYSWCKTKTGCGSITGQAIGWGPEAGYTLPNQEWHRTLRILNSYVAFQVFIEVYFTR